LLDRLSDTQKDGNDTLPGLRVHPELSLDYPQSDITWIQERENGQGYEIETTFFGLYGVSSPLPGFYTEELFDDDWDEQKAARGFLDIIHHRLYPMLYQAWLKYRFNFNAIEHNNSQYWEIIYSLIGLSEEFRNKLPNPGMLLKYTGIIGMHPKSQLGLQTILSDMFKHIPISIEPCVKRQVKIIPQQKCLLGQQNNTIGQDSVVGEFVADRSGKFRINLGPVDQTVFEELASDNTLVETIRSITSLFLIKPLLYDIQLLLLKGAEQPVQIGDEGNSSLGKNTWLGESSEEQAFSLILN
jgi:type VI secretion system protein ImpH